MKILVIPSWYPPNGGDFFVNQTKWLMEEGIEMAVISVNDRGIKQFKLKDIKHYFRIYFIEFFGIPTYRKIQYRIPFLLRPNVYIWIRIMIRLADKYIKDFGKPDLIQVHSSMWGGVVAARIFHKYKIPYVITEHRGRFNQNSSSFKGSRLHWYQPLLKEALKNPAAVIPVSSNMIPVLEKYAGKKIPAISIPNPVDENLFVASNSNDKVSGSTKLISISAFTAWKALDVLIEAFRIVAGTESDIQLDLIGNGPGYSKIKGMVEKYGLSEKIRFHGMLESKKVHKLLAQSDFLILSSNTEGQPVVVGEAILSGIPVIATEVVSKEDVPDYAGVIVKKNDPASLAEVIIKALKEKDKYKPESIREFGLMRFSKTGVIKRIVEVMKTAVSKNN